ncbi:hypothetical protein [Clostridium sp.]|uniref:hypothetical protein n=1 Tax=Clostridium sp. TaxID=1506 RepID=UPI002FDD71B3
MKNRNTIGSRVHVTGEVKYGNKTYRVDSNGTIKDINYNNILVSIDIIDGDTNANILVHKKNISRINEYI